MAELAGGGGGAREGVALRAANRRLHTCDLSEGQPSGPLPGLQQLESEGRGCWGCRGMGGAGGRAGERPAVGVHPHIHSLAAGRVQGGSHSPQVRQHVTLQGMGGAVGGVECIGLRINSNAIVSIVP